MLRLTHRFRSAPEALMLMACGNALALGWALFAQHGLGMLPCAWCIVQRIDVILLLVVSLVGARLSRVAPRAAPGVSALIVLSLAAGGGLAAWHQHTVAAKQLSCAFTWADRTLMALGLENWWPAVFQVQASCADAAQATLLGWPFELWSAAWFGVCVLWSLRILALALRPRSQLVHRSGLPVH